MTEAVAAAQLRSYVERIERIEEEAKSLADDKSDIYKEAKSNGYDVKALKRVIAYRRKDANEAAEAEALFDLYLSSLGMIPDERGTADATRARTTPSVSVVRD